MKAVFVVIIMGLVFSYYCSADTIVLTNGSRVEGQITGETNDSYIVETDDGELKYALSKKKVRSIIRSSEAKDEEIGIIEGFCNSIVNYFKNKREEIHKKKLAKARKEELERYRKNRFGEESRSAGHARKHGGRVAASGGGGGGVFSAGGLNLSTPGGRYRRVAQEIPKKK